MAGMRPLRRDSGDRRRRPRPAAPCEAAQARRSHGDPRRQRLWASIPDTDREDGRRADHHPPAPARPVRAAGARLPMISYLALAVISAAILAYEVLLVRLFAIVHWH